MSVLLICPACEQPHTLLRLPVSSACTKCGQPFPATSLALAEQTLRAEAVPRPALLTVGMVFSAFWAGTALVATVTTILSSGGSYSINGKAVSREEFLSEPFVLGFPLAILYAGAVAFALYRELPWARPWMLFPWIAYVVAIGFMDWPGTAERVTGIVVALICLGIASWYLYLKRNVVAYYQRLDARQASHTT